MEGWPTILLAFLVGFIAGMYAVERAYDKPIQELLSATTDLLKLAKLQRERLAELEAQCSKGPEN